MIRPDGLTEDEMDVYHRGLAVPHWRQIEVEVTTLDGELVSHLTPEVTGGNVIVDAEAGDDVTSRILDMTFAQPRRMLFEPQSASDMPFHRKYAIHVVDSRLIPELGRWVECPVFSGPLWDFDRTGAEVRVVGHGWERQAFCVKWNEETYKQGKRKTDVIKDLLREAGFTQLGGIPDLSATLPERFTVTKRDVLWPAIVKLAKSMDRHIFFDGQGRPRLRRLPDAPSFIFDDRHLLGDLVVDRQAQGTPNVFEVVGAKPKGPKRRPRDVRELDPSHPNSKESLALNGEPYRVLVREENRAIKTQAEAVARTLRLRERAERGMTDTQVDVLPFPHFDELDLVAVADAVGAERVRLNRFSLGLSRDATPLSINSIRRTHGGRGRSGKDLRRGVG